MFSQHRTGRVPSFPSTLVGIRSVRHRWRDIVLGSAVLVLPWVVCYTP